MEEVLPVQVDVDAGFQQFFQSVRSINARLTAAAPQGDATTATARVTGSYEYVDAAGKPQTQLVAFTATFRRDGTRWRIVATR